MSRTFLAGLAVAAFVFVSGAASFYFVFHRTHKPEEKVELKVPAEVLGDPGVYVSVPAVTNGKDVKWVVLDPGISLFPTEFLKSSKTAVLSTAKKGQYRVLAVTALNDQVSEPAICVIKIGEQKPGPDVPPDVPPDEPKDPLLDKLQAIYGADVTTNKATIVKMMVKLYREAAKVITENKNIDTYGKFYSLLVKTAESLDISHKLLPLQEEVAKELKKVLPTDYDEKINDSNRQPIADKFTYLAGIMEKLK